MTSSNHKLNFLDVWCHLRIGVFLVDLLDELLRVTLDDDLADAEADDSMKSREQTVVLRRVVGDVSMVVRLDDVLQAVTSWRGEDDPGTSLPLGVGAIEVHGPGVGILLPEEACFLFRCNAPTPELYKEAM